MNIYFFLSVTGVTCSGHCQCLYDQGLKVNIMTCTNKTVFPAAVPNFTDWIIVQNMNIQKFCTTYQYIDSKDGIISFLSIEYSNFVDICDSTLKSILSSPRLKQISFANNNLTKISIIWKTHGSHLEKVWLGGNPIQCHCDMLWTMDWLQNATGTSGHRLVQDYQDVICATRPQRGTPVYKLNRVTMGCYPKHTPIWIITTSSSVGGVILILVIGIIFVHRNRKLARWLIYKNFDKLLGDPDRNEDITDKQFDAFISFRLVKLVLQLQKIIPFKGVSC